MRLILFDIDGTLIFGHGVGHRSLVRAMEETYGTSGNHNGYDWRGKTDPQIVRELMRAEGIAPGVVEERLPACFDRYVRHLDELLAQGHRVDVLPGIGELLQDLAQRSDVLVGLLTGNIERGAQAKLRRTGLSPLFQVGAYGSDDPNRRNLPAIARDRAQALLGREIAFSEIDIIGDTPLDVDCARCVGARAIAVASGQHSLAELEATNPDLLFENFADLEACLLKLGHCRLPAAGGGSPLHPPLQEDHR
jgi:phosphoglycolate phosphatase